MRFQDLCINILLLRLYKIEGNLRMNKLITISLMLSLGIISACQKKDLDQPAVNKIITDKSTNLINDDYSQKSPHWKVYTGEWEFQKGVLIQTSENNDFPVILYEKKPVADLDISVRFKPLSGKIDASGGLIFRAEDEDNYYIVRANALEGNFRLYTFTDGYRHQLASASVTPPTKGEFHTLRVVAKGNHIQAYLDDGLKLDYHDDSFKKGYVGLWTKADSVSVFDDFNVNKLMK